jgi:formimidoylglutamate deiminase
MLASGFARDVRIEIGEDGTLTDLKTGAAAKPGDHLADIVVPGISDLHCHAFQRAMAGHAERTSGDKDTFWSWRTLMYDLANKITPDDLASIAAQAYLEFLKSGYTSVAEFHYLHGMGNKSAPGNVEMSEAIFVAATQTGIGLTHLPVLYEVSGFGQSQPSEAQKSFHHTPEEYVALLETLSQRAQHHGNINLGIAFHSLRAVRPETLINIDKWAGSSMTDRPVHIHIAEQEREVQDCLVHHGARPVEWLLDTVDVDASWCLIHATHMTRGEVERAAKTGAVAGLCPSTEANLGDGHFNLPRWLEHGGALGTGSDSNVCPSPVEELRWLEYGARLQNQQRLIATSDDQGNTGAFLWSRAAQGGAKALGRNTGVLKSGNAADFLVLDQNHPALCAAHGDGILNALIFGPSAGAICDVYVAGDRVIKNGAHAKEQEISARFNKTVRRLLDA